MSDDDSYSGKLQFHNSAYMNKKPIHISQGRSLPHNFMAPSLLTSLAPELRNCIYELLYVRDTSVEITRSNESLRWYEREGQHTGPSVKTTRRQLALSMPLLQSCRQIYHEAIGVLYSRNTFAVRSFAPGPHLEAASTALGSHTNYLRRLEINLATLFRDRYPTATLEFLHLLRIVWAHPCVGLSVSITDQLDAERWFPNRTYNTTTLNCVAQLLGSQDVLDFKKYGRIKSQISSISVNADGLSGSIYFSGTDCAPCVVQGFSVSDDGSAASMRRPDRPVGFERLPYRTQSQIFRYVLHTPKGIDVNSLNKMSSPFRHALFYVNWSLACKSLILENQLTFEVSCPSVHACSPDLTILRGWFSGRFNCHVGTRRPVNQIHLHEAIKSLEGISHAKVIFNFQVASESQGLNHVRLNIMELLGQLTHAPDSLTLCCRTVMLSTTPQSMHEAEFNVRTLRLNALIALSEVLVAQRWRENFPCPAVYIDGFGNAVEPRRKRLKPAHRLPHTKAMLGPSKEALATALRSCRAFRGSLTITHKKSVDFDANGTFIEVIQGLCNSCLDPKDLYA